MARFMVVHSTAALSDQEQAVAGAREMIASLPPDVKWLSSWLALKAPKMFCEWEGPDMDAILAALKPVLEQTPVEALYEVAHVDPRWYAEE